MSNDARDTLAVIPWYWRDWRASKARAVLISDPAALLAYRELLDALWGEADCCLPEDDESLAALAGLAPDAWSHVKERVLRFFPKGDDGRRSNPRARFEWQKAGAYREACRSGGLKRAEKLTPEERHDIAVKAANARWMPTKQADDARVVLAHACTPSPSASASASPPPTDTETPSVSAAPKRRKATDPIALDLKNRIGSGTKVCLDQVRALRAAGWDDARLQAAVDAHAIPGVSPWEWTRLALGTVQNGHAPRDFVEERAASVRRLVDKFTGSDKNGATT